MSYEKPPEQRTIDWGKVIEEALVAPGDLCGVYDRFHDYSLLNKILLMMQGVYEPVATYKRWSSLGRQVLKGAQAKEIIVPLIAYRENGKGEKEETLTGFKGVRCIFGLSETTGKDLPPVTVPGWDMETALAKLNVRRVPFSWLDGNAQGYSHGRDIAVNPVAVNPTKTLIHELGHVVLGHTMPDRIAEYATHRGVAEFQAEATAYLTLHELERLDEQTAAVSRGYIRGWLDNERPPDSAIRGVFSATDRILKSGRLAVNGMTDQAG